MQGIFLRELELTGPNTDARVIQPKEKTICIQLALQEDPESLCRKAKTCDLEELE